jgi:magnesium transporter
MLTATAMTHYEGEIARAVVLALFVPLIISSGGNSGSQAASLIIRALALKELSLTDWWRVCRREILSGLTLGRGWEPSDSCASSCGRDCTSRTTARTS